jgi:uncharacterized protein (TIGR02217 family)
MADFHEVQFPCPISRGATGGPSFRTRIVPSASGFEWRNAEWSEARGQWDVGKPVRNNRAYFEAIITFHRRRRGALHGFRFKDWSDYKATGQLLIAAAAGGETTVQLIKTYTDATGTSIRTIKKPVAGTVQLYRNGIPLASSVNTVTGVCTFAALSAADVLTADFEFDVPVRFADDDLRLQMMTYDAGGVPQIGIIEIKLDDDGQG